jgi:hypothetical protein
MRPDTSDCVLSLLCSRKRQASDNTTDSNSNTTSDGGGGGGGGHSGCRRRHGWFACYWHDHVTHWWPANPYERQSRDEQRTHSYIVS